MAETRAEVWVVNASPLIALGAIGQLGLLIESGRKICVPEGVALEIGQGADDDAAARWLAGPGAGHVVAVPQLDGRVASWDLGLGESHVLTACLAGPPAWAVVDDRAARRCAKALSVPCLGTLAVVALARRQGRIPAAAPVYAALRRQGFRISQDVLRAVLEQLGE
ncbi:MAG TPA: DUF3368 domain-containing protein [Solidesulfovibrio magneticus]|nr:DUF3368 domain-containing protein [Solidesulfovibrio magneticus]